MPTRPECAVTLLWTPATCAATVNRSPTICSDNGTTRLPGSGLVAARSVRRARATPFFTKHTSFVSPSWFVLLRCTVTRIPVAVGRIDDVGPAQRANLAAPHPCHEQQSRGHRIETPPPEGNLIGLDAAPAPTRPVAGGEHGGQVRDPERARPGPAPDRRRSAGTRPVPGPAARQRERPCPASFARKHAAATAIEALDEARLASCISAR